MIFLGSAYSNGNYYVTRKSGTMIKRCFRVNEDFISEFPDSIDLKISNRCSIGCPYCHEESFKDGKIANLEETIKHLSQLPEKPIEIAIGGGNILEDDQTYDLLVKLLKWFSGRNNKVNITISEKSLSDDKQLDRLQKLHKFVSDNSDISKLGIGISLGPDITEQRINQIKDSLKWVEFDWSVEIVYHVILGLFPIPMLKLILTENCFATRVVRILFLGYKQFGRAKKTELPPTIPIFETLIKKKIIEGRGSTSLMQLSNMVLGFDNLAIEQLNLSGSFLDLDFNDIYLGPEFSCSMYVDAVKGEFARTSTSTDRTSWNKISILDYFKQDA